MKLIKVQINSVPGMTGTRNIRVDVNGTPLDRVWRKRFKDAKIDNCVEVIQPTKPTKQKKED